jgi:para-aminobenzoate synthetase component 1
MNSNFVITGGVAGSDVDVITDDLSVMDAGGRWFVVGLFEGPVLAMSFKNWCSESEFLGIHHGRWAGVGSWTTDADQSEYESRVELTRTRIAQGDVYQANVCRLMSADFPASSDVLGLYQLIQKFNPAPMSCVVNIVDSRLEAWGMQSLEIASASPEIFLIRSGSAISSSPIKGTAAVGSDFLAKDNSENIMIVDLVRNDLSRVCEVATVSVPHLLEAQSHRGPRFLVQLSRQAQ